MGGYCGCIDFPACGHGSVDGSKSHPLQGHLDPEDAESFLEGLSEDEREFALATMTPCPLCGELRPKNDESIRRNGHCYMCGQDENRRRAPSASNNLRFFSAMITAKDKRIADLEAEVERLKGEVKL